MNEPETRHEDTTVPTTEPTPEVEVVPQTEVEVTTTEVEAESAPVTDTPDDVESVATVETTTEATPDQKETSVVASIMGTAAAIKTNWNRRSTYTVAALCAVVVILLAFLFVMERQGRLDTGLFAPVHRIVDTNTAVVKVNDGKITKYDLDVSMSQMAAGFAAQGMDTESDEVKTEIQTRAVDMLVNTELLKQAAAAKGVVVTDEDVDARLETLKTDVGGEEVLKERMAEFNVSEKILRRDIKNELTIQALLEGVFEEKNITVSEEEITEFYEKAGGVEAGLPELAAVKDQIEQQLRTTKEQEIVTAYIEELRASASIEMLL